LYTYTKKIVIVIVIILTSLFSLLLLSGCGTLKRPTPTLNPAQRQQIWIAHQEKITPLEQWKVEGRIAVRHAEQGESASLVWEKKRDIFKLQLFGPFGSGAIQLAGDKTHVTMHQNNKVFEAPTAEALLYQELKWHLPLSHLNYWAKGIPVPDMTIDHVELDPEGYLAVLIQDGWRIEYENYQSYGKWILPKRLHLNNPKLDVKLILRKWGDIH
jgi:outer membrane lipoprotein LolB